MTRVVAAAVHGYDDISEDEDFNSTDGTNHRRFGFGQIRRFVRRNWGPRLQSGVMASRNLTFQELVPGRRKPLEMLMEAGLAEPEEQQPTCSKMSKRKKKKRLQDDDEHDGVAAEPEPKTICAKSRSRDSKADLKKKDADQKADVADKKAESFVEQAGTSTALSLGRRARQRKQSLTPWINPKETVGWNLDSLVTLNVLGRGSFGIVYLVRHRINRQLAALKYIRKKNQNSEKERRRVEVEKSVWEAVTDHPFVVNFRAYFETAKGPRHAGDGLGLVGTRFRSVETRKKVAEGSILNSPSGARESSNGRWYNRWPEEVGLE
ncbi:hypothetical protein HPB47_012508 [Ixodes persulcatus]|uniref:Uncharacterized protein n=1 Tax=Ixodes persulcatus TaxID=34615 RepID=A0AC60NT95_IXOPE|nr:hypothetical protein HPB47_012508 [Ixodes persulcatus]